MKTIYAIILTFFVASSASAVIDSGENSVGLYFDESADVYCVGGIAPNDHVMMYLILANPSFDFLYGWECGIDLAGDAMVLGRQFYTMVCFPGPPNNMIIGYGTPYPTTIATPLVALEIMYMDSDLGPVDFYVHGTTPSSINPDYPAMLTNDGEFIMAGISIIEGPAAQINGDCTVVATENISFDSVKSLYRN